MTTTYTKRSLDSDLSSGGHHNKVLNTETAALVTENIPMALSETVEGHHFTEAGVPGADGITGDYTVEINVVTGVSDCQLSVAVGRVNSSGTVQSESAFTAEQAAVGGVLTFSLTAIDLGTWATGDRLRIRARYRNSHTHTSRSVDIGWNTTDSQVTAPWTAATAHTATVTDDVGVTDEVSVPQAHTATITDSVGLTDDANVVDTDLPVTDGLVLDLDASKLVLNDNDPVATWEDSSGSGNGAAQSTAGNQPAYSVDGYNGNPAVVFDGVDDYMTIPNDPSMEAARPTIFMVLKVHTATTTWDTMFVHPDSDAHVSPFFRWSFQSSNNGSPAIRWNGSSTTGTAQTEAWWEENVVWRLHEAELRRDGVLIISTTLANITYPNVTNPTIGARVDGGENASMTVAQLAFYDRVLTAQEITDVEDHLTGKWIAAGTRVITDSVDITDEVPRPSDWTAWVETTTDSEPVGTVTLTDAVGITDAPAEGVASYFYTNSDDVGLTDEVVASRSIVVELTSSVGVGDEVATSSSVVAELADDVGVSDNTAIAASVELANDVGIVDEPSRTSSATISVVDDVGVGDEVSHSISGTVGVDLTNAVGVSDDTSTASGAVRSNTDAIGTTDDAVASRDIAVELSDSIGVVDDTAIAVSVELTSNINIADESDRSLSYVVSVADSVGVGDEVGHSASGAIGVDLTNTVGVSDDTDGVASTVRSDADDVGVVDEHSTSSSYASSIADSVGAADELAVSATIDVVDDVGATDDTEQVATVFRDSSDSVAVSDSSNYEIEGQSQRSLTSQVGTTDAVELVQQTFVSTTDDVGADDTVNVAVAGVKSTANDVGVTDTVEYSLAAVTSVEVTDSVGTTDELGAAAATFTAVQDDVGIADTHSTVGSITVTVTDDVGFTDDIAQDYVQEFIDAIGVADTVESIIVPEGLRPDFYFETVTVAVDMEFEYALVSVRYSYEIVDSRLSYTIIDNIHEYAMVNLIDESALPDVHVEHEIERG